MIGSLVFYLHSFENRGFTHREGTLISKTILSLWCSFSLTCNQVPTLVFEFNCTNAFLAQIFHCSTSMVVLQDL